MKFIDTMIKDGLWDAFNGYHMGTTAENVAEPVADHPRAAGRVRARLARTRPRRRRRPAGSRTRSRPSPSRPARATSSSTSDEYIRLGATIDAMTEAPARLLQGRHRHRRQRLGPQRRRRRGGADDRRGGGEARHRAARPHRLLGHRRRRSRDHGHRPDPGLAQGAGEGRLEGLRPRPRRGQRGLRGPGLRGQQGHGLGPVDRERQRRRHRHRPPDRRLAARASSTRCSSR